MTTTASNPEIAKTILAQINASGFFVRAELGVREMLDLGDGLQLNCARGKRALVRLSPDDTYTVEIGVYHPVRVNRKTYAVTGGTYEVKKTVSMVYVENLVDVLRSGLT